MSRTAAVVAALILAAWGCLWPTTAAAQQRCSAQIQNLGRIQRTDSYDPFAGAAVAQYNRFEIRHGGGPACAVAAVISGGASGQRTMASGAGTLDYELYRDAGLSTAVSDINGSPSGWLTAYLSPGAAVGVEFFFVVPAGQVAEAGRYDDTVVVEVYALNGGLPDRRLASRQAAVRADVLASVQTTVSIDGSPRTLSGGALGTLDFGTLESGATRGFQLDVQGNTGYQVTLESENRGVLTGSSGTIPYTLSMDGQSVALGRAASFTYTFARARTHAVMVSIGDVARVLAGTYQDNLYLTVTAR